VYNYDIFNSTLSPALLAASCIFFARKVCKLRTPWSDTIAKITLINLDDLSKVNLIMQKEFRDILSFVKRGMQDKHLDINELNK